MRVRYVLLLTLLLLTFTGIRLTSAERARALIATDDNVQLRSRHIRSDVSLDTPSIDTIERIRAVMAEMALYAAEKHHPETLFSANADFNSEKTNQWLNDIEYPEEFLQILEEMRNSLVYEGKEGITSELEKRLITAVGVTGGTGTTLPWDTPNRSDIVAPPPPLKQSSHQDEAVLNRKDKQPQTSKWIQIGQFDDESSVRSVVKPHPEVSEKDLSMGADDAHPASVSPSLPKSYRLSQNYPNPFNPSTTIEIDIPDRVEDTQQVKVSVYEVRGRLIRILMDEQRGPGRYKIAWNGNDDKGESVSSGVYLYRIEAGHFASTKKMALAK